MEKRYPYKSKSFYFLLQGSEIVDICINTPDCVCVYLCISVNNRQFACFSLQKLPFLGVYKYAWWCTCTFVYIGKQSLIYVFQFAQIEMFRCL